MGSAHNPAEIPAFAGMTELHRAAFAPPTLSTSLWPAPLERRAPTR